MGFEAAPFKLPLDYVDIMGGLDSPGWLYFRKLFKEGFECARKHSDSLISESPPNPISSNIMAFGPGGTILESEADDLS